MMRTSNLFPLARRYSKQKPDQECKAPPMVAKLLTGLFLSVVGNQEEERDKSCEKKKKRRSLNWIKGGVIGRL